MRRFIRRTILIPLWIILIFLSTLSCRGNAGTERQNPATAITKQREVRKPAKAGQFYPADKKSLESSIKGYLNEAETVDIKGKLIGLVVPHAGHPCSGPVAAYSYKNLIGKKIDTIILVGSSHHVNLKNVSINNKDYETPLGVVKLDAKTREEICSKIEGDCLNEECHKSEHSLEVQLPFIQMVQPDVSIVPILINNPDNVAPLAKALSQLEKENDNILFIASTDLSHYLEYKEAVDVDKKIIDKILSLDEKKILADMYKPQESPCGSPALATIMLAAKLSGANKGVLYKYLNSGDTCGNRRGVVGYSAIGFYKTIEERKERKMTTQGKLSHQQQAILLKLARESMETYVKSSKPIEVKIDDPELNAPLGAFVTLKINGVLRGCIGRFGPTESLAKTVAQMAVEAAVRDPRFPPVSEEELDKIDIEISVLSPLEECKDVNKIEVGVHGLEIQKGWHKGVLLPQVATEWGWDRETFLENTCLKAGLDKDAWKEEDTTIYTFTAQVFGEKELNS